MYQTIPNIASDKKNIFIYILIMKKIILLLSLLFSIFCLYANDTYFFMAGGQLVPTKEGNVDVEMSEEIINIVLNPKNYEITVDFSFYNYGKDISLEIGFPFFCLGIGGEGTISDFKCWTNDVETSYTDYPLKKNWSTNEPTELENAYVRTIQFPSKKTTKTRISYKSTYGREAPSYFIAKYLYGTGSSWKNAIGKMIVRIQNNMMYDSPSFVALPEADKMKKINENTWEGTFTNIEPQNYTDCITLEIGDIFGDTGPRILQKDRFVPCKRKLTQQDLFWYTKPQLRLLRNAIYAFNGYPFKSKDLIELFEVQCAEYGWFGFKEINGDYKGYYPLDKNFSEDKLSDIEKYNVKLSLEAE